MNLKLRTGEYLDGEVDAEMVRQVKTADDMSETSGDFSYVFELPLTSHNSGLLIPYPDLSNKKAYRKINCDLVSEGGIPIYEGFLLIEKIRADNYTIEVSFRSGNNNWFRLLSGQLQEIDWSEFDTEQTSSNIILTHSATSGIVYQVIDNVGLERRGYRQLKVEDFVPGIYVKTVFAKIFQNAQITIEGELLQDPTFNSILTVKNGKSQEDIDAVSTYAGKTSTTARGIENTDYKITFDTDTLYPYYDGAADAFDIATSTYTAPFKMVIDIEVILQPSIVDASYNNRIYLYINGVFTFVDIGLAVGAGGLYNSSTAGSEEFFRLEREITLEAGDTLEVYSDWQQSSGSTPNDVISGSIKITPRYIYFSSGATIVPNWSQADYVSNILRLFNVICDYNEHSKTLTLDLFDRMHLKPAQDLSEFISETSVDYIDFISNYGRETSFRYSSVEFEDLRKYNVQNFFRYGTGIIDVDNDGIVDRTTAVELDFVTPVDYLNPVFGMSMAKTDLVRLVEDQVYNVTSVTDSSGQARLNLPENNVFVGDLIRISESSNPGYNGDWVINAKGTGYLEAFGLLFDTDATAKVSKLKYEYNDSDNVFLLWNIAFYNVSDISTFPNFRFTAGDRTFASFGYFSLLNMNMPVNDTFRQSLSFGPVNSQLFYQSTMLETYWRQFERVLNDPVQIQSVVHLPLSTYSNLDLLAPVRVNTFTTTNLYFIERTEGYKGSHLPATITLVKLS